MGAYQREYSKIPARCPSTTQNKDNMIQNEAFCDWTVHVPFKGRTVDILCCPEDIKCTSSTDHNNAADGCYTLCAECEVPICSECEASITKPKPCRPQLSLSNDMWFGYIPELIYEKEVTYMEMLCASICHPTMMSFQANCYGWNNKKEKVHMQEHRVGARGNMAAFQVPWETIFAEMHRLKETAVVQLPRVGKDLLQLVHVVLHVHGGDEPTKEEKRKLLQGATVRRDVVIELIDKMKELGHRDYVDIDMDCVKQRALLLHSGNSGDAQIPDGVLANTVLHNSRKAFAADGDAGKMSVPAGRLAQGNCFSDVRAFGAEQSDSKFANVDVNTQMCSALLDVNSRMSAPTDSGVSSGESVARDATMKLIMGEARSQFEATFFLTAYAFLFPYSVGAPDLKFQSRDRRPEDAPKVDFARDWGKCLVQRAEGQFRRDLTLPFALWNLTFRTTINIGHNMHSVKRAVDASTTYTATDISDAAVNISKCLAGKYETLGGKSLHVGGDIRKLRTAKKLSPPLSQLSKRMLQSMEGTAKKIEGTHQTRSMMRYELCAYRVNKGLPIFITWSPNERHNALMIRMSRTRMSDPLAKHCKQHKHWGKINEPRADGSKDDSNTNNTVLGEVSVDALIDTLPNTDVRRKILAKDPLASVYGFRLLCKITLSALFGGRVCSKCPECNHGEHGCVDMFGSVAKAEGGISGRMEAFYGSIENQKEDSQHLHTMIWLQSMYQQKTLIEIAQMIRDNTDLVTDTHAFSEHVCQESYHKPLYFKEQRDALEEESPEYFADDCLFQHKSLPDNNATCDVQASTQSPAVVAGGDAWVAAYSVSLCQLFLIASDCRLLSLLLTGADCYCWPTAVYY